MLAPTDSFRVPEELIEPLYALYQHESEEVNRTMQVGRSFSVSWTREELIEILARESHSEDVADALFEHLSSSDRVVPLHGSTDKPYPETRYRTDTAELVRLSTFNYNRYLPKEREMAPTQAGVTWSIEGKNTPCWSRAIDSAIEEIHSEIDNGWVDETGTVHPYDAPKLEEAVSIVLGTYNLSYGNEGRLSEFQFRSIVQTLRGIYAGGSKTLAIVGGTGSGKSYGFQLGAVIAIVEQRLAGTLNSVHSLFLYPRVALMADQREALEKLLELINAIHLSGIEIRWASDGGSFLKTIDYRRLVNPDIEPDVLEKKGIREIIRSIYADPNKCPHLVFANPDTLTNRLGDPAASHFLTNGLKNLVVDEIHLLESITGANSAGVIRRLCALTTSEMMLTGSSATVAEEKDHLSKVFGRPHEGIVTVTPDPDTEMELTGIIHHVLHRGVEGQNYISNLTNLTSLVGHIRRRRIEEEPERIEDSHKTLGFADSLQLLGSWEYQVRDNEGLELTKTMRNRMRDILYRTLADSPEKIFQYKFTSNEIDKFRDKTTAVFVDNRFIIEFVFYSMDGERGFWWEDELMFEKEDKGMPKDFECVFTFFSYLNFISPV